MARITKKPAVRRKELVEAALGLFLARGYDGTSVRDILGEVGGAPGMFYYYFRSKEEIFDAALDAYAQRHGARLAALAEDRGAAITEKLPGTILLLQEIFREIGALLQRGEAAGGKAAAADMLMQAPLRAIERLTDPLAALLEECFRLGLLPDTPLGRSATPRQAAGCILYACLSLVTVENGQNSINNSDGTNVGLIPVLAAQLLGLPMDPGGGA